MSNNSQIKITADVSDAEKAFHKLKKTMQDVDDSTAKNTNTENLTKQQIKEVNRISDSLEEGIKNFQKEHLKALEQLSQKQKKLEESLSRARSSSKKETLQANIDEVKQRKKLMEQDSRNLHTEYMKRKKMLEKYNTNPIDSNSNNPNNQPNQNNTLPSILKYINAIRTGGIGGLFSGGSNGTGLLGGMLGKLGIAVAGLFAVGKLISGIHKKYGEPTYQKDKEAYKVVQDLNEYGSNFRKARKDFREAGATYGLKTQESIDIAGNLIATKGFSTKMQLNSDISAVARYSKATGLDANMVATKLGNVSRASKTSINDLANLADGGAISLGLQGRQDKVLDALERIAEIGLETKGSIDKAYLEEYMNSAKNLKDGGMDGAKALEKALDITQSGLRSRPIQSALLAGSTSIKDYNDRKARIEDNDPEVLREGIGKLISYGYDPEVIARMLNEQGMGIRDSRRLVYEYIKENKVNSEGNLDQKLRNYQKSEQGTKEQWDAKKERWGENVGDSINSVYDTGRWTMNNFDKVNKIYDESDYSIQSDKFTMDTNIRGSKREYTEEQLNQIIDSMVSKHEASTGKESALRGTGKYFLESAKKHNISVEALLGMAIHESGGGTSNQAINKNNFFGYKSYNNSSSGATTFYDKAEGIDTVAKLLSENYVDRNNQDTLWKITDGVSDADGIKYNKYNVNNEKQWATSIAKIADDVTRRRDNLPQKITIEVKGKIDGISPENEKKVVDSLIHQLEQNMTRE